MRKLAASILLLLLGGLVCRPALAADEVRPISPQAALSVVRVNSTNQDYDFFRPWSKKSPRAFHGLGSVIAGNRVLVTAQLVANHSYVELERAESGQRTDAKVLCVDYESNLALLQPVAENFLADLKPLDLTLDAAVGDRVGILQLESNDALVSTPAPISTIEVGRYQLEGQAFLLYKLSVALQYREGSFTAPVIKDGKLAGILMRYDPRSQSVDVLPSPIIAHFLKDFDDGNYQGFPHLGVETAPTRDPQLRHYAKLPAGTGGIYVTSVIPNGPAAKAGVKEGDVILQLGDSPVDQDGNYEEKLYGRIAFANLVTTRSYAGDKLSLKISREGATQTLEVTVTHEPAESYVSQPFVIDQPPRYYVVDGLIFEELSRQYLKEWGGDWQKTAPQRLVYLDRYQSTVVPSERKRIVILSQVLPTASNIGLEDLKYLVVSKVNGREIRGLEDLSGALAQPLDGFHKVEFEEYPRQVFLDAAHLEENDRSVMETYGLPELKRLN